MDEEEATMDHVYFHLTREVLQDGANQQLGTRETGRPARSRRRQRRA